MPFKTTQETSAGRELELANPHHGFLSTALGLHSKLEDFSHRFKPTLARDSQESSSDTLATNVPKPLDAAATVSPNIKSALALQKTTDGPPPKEISKLSPEIDNILASMNYPESIVNVAIAKNVQTRHHLLYEMRKEVDRIREGLGLEPWVEEPSLVDSFSFLSKSHILAHRKSKAAAKEENRLAENGPQRQVG